MSALAGLLCCNLTQDHPWWLRLRVLRSSILAQLSLVSWFTYCGLLQSCLASHCSPKLQPLQRLRLQHYMLSYHTTLHRYMLHACWLSGECHSQVASCETAVKL